MTRIEDLWAKVEALGDGELMLAVQELAQYRKRMERYDLATTATAYMGVTESQTLEDAQAFMRRMLRDALEDEGVVHE